MNDTVAIVIPVYKTVLNINERKSIHSCCKVLKNYEFLLIAPEGLNTTTYEEEFKINKINYQIILFDQHYFCDISKYNKLLLSKNFYEHFIKYEYILIYQLDAYVFRDELKNWCEFNFDFIGAPLIGKCDDTTFSTNMRVGNGGLSLRKVKTFLQYFDSKKNVFNVKQIIQLIQLWKKPYTRIFVLLLMLMGWRNKPLSVAKNWKYNEDDFWTGLLDNSNYALKKPSPNKALEFSFERFPKECFQLIGKLPFGCHGWEKYQYKEFWINYIF